jgi:putative aldouronate transport system permease protein
MLNEINNFAFKKVAQTISYLPHFISWVIIAGIITKLLSPSTGVVNQMITAFGGEPVFFMVSKKWFRTILVLSGIWKEIGWSSIIYLAAISSISPQLYEAAIIDGATRFQRSVRITLPSLLPVITIILILNMAHILNAGFDQVFNMYNPHVYEVADIIDTFVYRRGLVGMDYSFTAAVGMFKSVVGLVMVLIVNYVSSKMGEAKYGLFR